MDRTCSCASLGGCGQSRTQSKLLPHAAGEKCENAVTVSRWQQGVYRCSVCTHHGPEKRQRGAREKEKDHLLGSSTPSKPPRRVEVSTPQGSARPSKTLPAQAQPKIEQDKTAAPFLSKATFSTNPVVRVESLHQPGSAKVHVPHTSGGAYRSGSNATSTTIDPAAFLAATQARLPENSWDRFLSALKSYHNKELGQDELLDCVLPLLHDHQDLLIDFHRLVNLETGGDAGRKRAGRVANRSPSTAAQLGGEFAESEEAESRHAAVSKEFASEESISGLPDADEIDFANTERVALEGKQAMLESSCSPTPFSGTLTVAPKQPRFSCTVFRCGASFILRKGLDEHTVAKHSSCAACRGLQRAHICKRLTAAGNNSTTDSPTESCAACGLRNEAQRMFCVFCGEKISAMRALKTSFSAEREVSKVTDESQFPRNLGPVLDIPMSRDEIDRKIAIERNQLDQLMDERVKRFGPFSSSAQLFDAESSKETVKEGRAVEVDNCDILGRPLGPCQCGNCPVYARPAVGSFCKDCGCKPSMHPILGPKGSTMTFFGPNNLDSASALAPISSLTAEDSANVTVSDTDSAEDSAEDLSQPAQKRRRVLRTREEQDLLPYARDAHLSRYRTRGARARRRKSSPKTMNGAEIPLSIGSAVKVYWKTERRWFRGVIQRSKVKHDGQREYLVDYDDGDHQWELNDHDMKII